MKRFLYPIIKPLILGVIAVERQVFFITGYKMRTLRRYYQAQACHIQRLLDHEHGSAQEACA